MTQACTPRLPHPARYAFASVLLLLNLAACHGDTAGPTPATPAALRLAAGDAQTGSVASALAQPVVVTVVDAQGHPVGSVVVSWRVTEGGGSARALAERSDAAGEARAEWTLGTVAGPQRIEASVTGLPPAQASANATAGPPATLAIARDTVRLTGVGDSTVMSATAKDAYGNTVASAVITWSTLDPSVLSIAAGRVRALGPGSGRVVAHSGSLADTAVVLVPATGILLTIAPSDWRLPVGETVQLRATATGVSVPDVVWRVNGVAGGNTQIGTIAADGLYRAPAAVPSGARVTVGATLRADAAVGSEVPVTISATAVAPRVLQEEWEPRVIRYGVTDSARLQVDIEGDGSLRLSTGTPLLPVRTGRFAVSLPRSALLNGYQQNDLHAFVSYMDLTDTNGARIGRYNMFVNVVDASVPPASVTSLAADAQASEHVLNLRVSDTSRSSLPAAIRRFYQLYPDDYDFLALVRQVNRVENRYYEALRNSIAGIGLSNIDRGAGYGSPARLLGVVHYPIDDYFDLGEQAATHEIGHRWMVFLRNLTGNGAHWPMSDLARGPMGFSIGGSGAGGTFPYSITPAQDGFVRVECDTVLRTFTDLDLYLMGLVPADSVRDHYILVNQAATPACGATVAANRLTMADVIAANGTRVPAAGSDRREFRLGAIVLSLDRLFTQDEMDFFEHMAARGEARQPLRFTSGLSSGTTLPFYLATGTRATLTTRLR